VFVPSAKFTPPTVLIVILFGVERYPIESRMVTVCPGFTLGNITTALMICEVSMSTTLVLAFTKIVPDIPMIQIEMATTGGANGFVLNIVELQNVITSAGGPSATLNTAVAQLQQMVLFDTKQIKADSVVPFTASNTSMSNTVIGGSLVISAAGTPGLGKYLTCIDTAGTAEWRTLAVPSDARFKKNIRPIDDASEILDGLHGARFEWLDGCKDIGVIAQDVEKVLPEAWRAGEPATVEYHKIIPVLIEVIKGLKADVKALNDRVSSMKWSQRVTPE